MGKGGKKSELIAGRIVKTFGLGGELYITLYYTFTDENIGEPVFIDIDGIRTPFFFQSLKRRGKNKAVVVFDDIENEHRAQELVGREFSMMREEQAEDGSELYMENLIGYTAIFEGNKSRAKITGFMESELNPLFEVEFEGRDLLIPAADDYIVSLDESHRTITFRVPEGLLYL